MPSLDDGRERFDVTLIEPARRAASVLFVAGRGGDPTRHRPLLEALAGRGCKVIAPHLDFLASPTPSAAELVARGRRLSLALEAFAEPGEALTGVGHSLGASLLLGLAGARLWTRSAECVELRTRPALRRLCLLAPALDSVQAPGALDAVATPIVAWAGTEDPFVAPGRLDLLVAGVGSRASVELRVIDGANHFSFMDRPPPQSRETLPDRAVFLAGLHDELARIALG
ncbi:MAG: alpha/beta hydrolase [Myxococcales bacterium]|nr:alpha/beta hydrolase [Myxococcales bacterium]